MTEDDRKRVVTGKFIIVFKSKDRIPELPSLKSELHINVKPCTYMRLFRYLYDQTFLSVTENERYYYNGFKKSSVTIVYNNSKGWGVTVLHNYWNPYIQVFNFELNVMMCVFLQKMGSHGCAGLWDGGALTQIRNHRCEWYACTGFWTPVRFTTIWFLTMHTNNESFLHSHISGFALSLASHGAPPGGPCQTRVLLAHIYAPRFLRKQDCGVLGLTCAYCEGRESGRLGDVRASPRSPGHRRAGPCRTRPAAGLPSSGSLEGSDCFPDRLAINTTCVPGQRTRRWMLAAQPELGGRTTAIRVTLLVEKALKPWRCAQGSGDADSSSDCRLLFPEDGRGSVNRN